MMVARVFHLHVPVHRSPIPTLTHDSGEMRAIALIGAEARQQRPELDRDAWPALVLKDAGTHHVFEEGAHVRDAGGIVGWGLRKLTLAGKNRFPARCKSEVQDRERR